MLKICHLKLISWEINFEEIEIVGILLFWYWNKIISYLVNWIEFKKVSDRFEFLVASFVERWEKKLILNIKLL